MLKMSDIVGAAVFAPKRRQGTARAAIYAQLGRVHQTVFAPDGLHVVGFLVKRPDIAGMVRREDVFVALDSLSPCDGGLLVTRAVDGLDAAARERLGLDWDSCLLWVGMDAQTRAGHELGYVGDVEFDAKTGAVSRIFIGDGGIARSLVGSIEVPATMLVGYRHGCMVVSDEASTLVPNGGLAAQAGAAVGKAQMEGAKAAERAGRAAERALDTGSRALGRQLGKTKGMFGAFMDEYKRASR